MAPVFTKVFHDDSCACARGGGGCINHNVFVMYHGTDRGNVHSILTRGFAVDAPIKSGRMLGTGIYASTDFNKTANYGDVKLKLLVYTGKVSR